jgi:hypothetical protein
VGTYEKYFEYSCSQERTNESLNSADSLSTFLRSAMAVNLSPLLPRVSHLHS